MKQILILTTAIAATLTATAQTNQWDQLKDWIANPPESFRMVVERSYYRGAEEPYHVGTTVIIKHGQQWASVLTMAPVTGENLEGRLDGKGKASLLDRDSAAMMTAAQNPVDGTWLVFVNDDPSAPDASSHEGDARDQVRNADSYRTFGLAIAGTRPETFKQVGQTLFADDQKPKGKTLRADLRINKGRLTGFTSLTSDKVETDCALSYAPTIPGIPDWMPVRTEARMSTGLRIVTDVKLYLAPHHALEQELHIRDLKGGVLAQVGEMGDFLLKDQSAKRARPMPPVPQLTQ